MKSYTFRTIIEPDGKFFHGYVPALSGCHTFGKTIAETQKNLREAIELHVETMAADGVAIPADASFESFETVMAPLKALRPGKKVPAYA